MSVVVRGQMVPLTLQLYDGKEGRKVIASVYDENDELLIEQQLNDVAQGYYSFFEYLAPEKASHLTAVYTVPNAQSKYEIVSDSFVVVESEDMKAYLDQVESKVAEVRDTVEKIDFPRKKKFVTGRLVSEKNRYRGIIVGHEHESTT